MTLGPDPRADDLAGEEQRFIQEHFGARYGDDASSAVDQVERAVIGGDWGANGYTTMAQADLLAAHLDLGPGRRLLDVGAGRGWPGLYLAATTGCDVVLTDVPPEALAHAAARADREGLPDRCATVVSNANHLPFGPGVFDGITHTDVLC